MGCVIFFYIQDSEDKYDIEVCETPEQNSFQTIYNVSVKEEQLQYGCLYKIVDEFVYTSPMITFETFVMNEPYCHPHKFEPLCCLETWQDINTNDIEVLHKRTKDLGVYEIKLSRCMYEINELKHQIDLLTYKKINLITRFLKNIMKISLCHLCVILNWVDCCFWLLD